MTLPVARQPPRPGGSRGRRRATGRGVRRRPGAGARSRTELRPRGGAAGTGGDPRPRRSAPSSLAGASLAGHPSPSRGAARRRGGHGSERPTRKPTQQRRLGPARDVRRDAPRPDGPAPSPCERRTRRRPSSPWQSAIDGPCSASPATWPRSERLGSLLRVAGVAPTQAVPLATLYSRWMERGTRVSAVDEGRDPHDGEADVPWIDRLARRRSHGDGWSPSSRSGLARTGPWVSLSHRVWEQRPPTAVAEPIEAVFRRLVEHCVAPGWWPRYALRSVGVCGGP